MTTPKSPAPDVSIILTVLNAEPFLAEAIRSVLDQQTSATWELLVVDDGSTDRSCHIARQFALRHPLRISLLHHPGGGNRGISASRNLALARARAPVIAFLDADDVWLPHRLATQLPLLAAHPEVAMVYAQAERWFDFDLPFSASAGSSGRNFVPALIPASARPGVLHPPVLLDWFLADESMTPCTCTVLVRTSVARRLHGFESPFTGLFDDQVFYSKLALEHPILVSLDVVARYRQHTRSCCAVARRDATEASIRHQFLTWLHLYRGRRLQPTSPPQPASAGVVLSP